MAGIEVISRGLIVHGRHVLLCRNVECDYSYLPGGHVEFAESAADALARELMEEAGVRLHVGECLSVDEHVFSQRGRKRHEMNIIFRADLVGMAKASTPPEVSSTEAQIEFEWATPSSLRTLDLRPPHHLEIVLRAMRTRGRGITRFVSRTTRSKRA